MIHLITGCMGSGKTERLIELADHVPDGRKLILAKAKNGEGYGSIKYTDQIMSRNGRVLKCDNPYNYGDFVPNLVILPIWCKYVFMDEGQWWNRFYVDNVQLLSKKGITFYISLLDRTYTGEHYDTFLKWQAVADQITTMHGTCAVTGGVAEYSELLTDVESVRKEDYRAVCWEVFKKSKHCRI